MAGQLIVLDTEAARKDAEGLVRGVTGRSRMRKAPTHLRDILVQMADGTPVNAEDACNALFVAAVASVSAQGQSMLRRRDADACQRLWNIVRKQMQIDINRVQRAWNSHLDLNDPEKVEAWLAS